MKISVIVPVYNVENYIEKCLDSILSQNFDSYEIIVVNDGSTDNSLEILKKYQKNNFNKIVLIDQENGGQGSARNNALKIARGKYIFYVDSDDWIEYNTLKTLYDIISEDKADIIIFGNNVVDIEGNILSVEDPKIYQDDKLNLLFGKMAIWNKMYKKKVLKDIVFREKLFYEDLDFTSKIILSNYKICFTNKILYNYLERPGSTMNNANITKNLEIIDALENLISYYRTEDGGLQNYNEIQFIAIYHLYITTIVRILLVKCKMNSKKILIAKIKRYMDSQFYNFKKNPYIKYLNVNKKIIYYLINFKLYNLIIMIFKIKKNH